jgi:TRAP-type C4-dicarboxylate transport system permease small subunit
MRASYIRLMDRLQWLCVIWCSLAIVAMTIMIFTGVVMRYVFETGARFAEPMSIFFAVQLTMYGAASCYRTNAHLRLMVVVNLFPERLGYLVDHLVQVLLGAVAIAMIYYGTSLARTTWFQAYPEFEYIRVGTVYAAIPISGAVFLLFVIERFFFGQQGIDAEAEELQRAIEQTEIEQARESAD